MTHINIRSDYAYTKQLWFWMVCKDGFDNLVNANNRNAYSEVQVQFFSVPDCIYEFTYKYKE